MSEYVEAAKLLLTKVGIPGLVGVPAAVLFTPEPWAARLGLLDLRNNYRMWFGLAFAVGVAALAAESWRWLLKGFTALAQRLSKSSRKAKLNALINALSASEREMLITAFYNPGGEYLPDVARQLGVDWEKALMALQRLGLVEKGWGIRSAYFCIPEEHMKTLKELVADDQKRAVNNRVTKKSA